MSGELTSAPASTTGDRREWVEFVALRLGGAPRLLELGRVEQILDGPTVTPVPRTAPTIAGVTNLGSEIPVVVDGRAVLGLPDRPPSADATLLLLERDDARPAGLLVDDVAGIEAHHVDAVAAPDEADWEPTADRRLFRAVVVDAENADEPVGVFDLDAILAEARDQS